MSMRDDERRLADLFQKIARIPKEKLDQALTENNIRFILANPALLLPTPAELDRILALQKFRNLYTTLDHFEKKYQIRTPILPVTAEQIPLGNISMRIRELS
jgi:hypothetical protein